MISLAIIGAGMSGASLYHHLDRSRFRIQIFEKSRGIGGRMSRKRVEDVGEFDHGAQFFTVRDEAFKRVVDRFGRSSSTGIWQPSLAYAKNGKFQLAYPSERYVSNPANQLIKELFANADIVKNSEVTKIIRANDSWSLRLQSQKNTDSFDWIVITAPSPQARELIEPHWSPEKKLAEMSPCLCLMLAYEKLDLSHKASFVNDEVMAWYADNSSKKRAGIGSLITIHGTPEFSNRYTMEHKTTMINQLRDSFEGLTGIKEDAIYQGSHFWRFAQPIHDSNNASGLCINGKLRMALCGDYLEGGRVEGAFMSGYRLAKYLNKISISRLEDKDPAGYLT